MSRTALRLVSSSLRPSARLSSNTAARAAVTRRMVSSESHAGHGSASSDRPWIIGSALVFGPLFLYLVSPSARKDHRGHAGHGHENHLDKHQHVESQPPEDVAPVVDDEGTQVSGQEVKESVEKALEADSPADAQEREEVVAKAETTAVEEDATTKTHPEAADATSIPVPESDAAPTLAVDITTQGTGGENATVPEPAEGSKA